MKFISLFALIIACAVQNASAILTWDVRAVSITTGMGTVNGPKSVTLVNGSPGAVITFDVWAVVTGTNGIVDETMQTGFGMLLSNGTLSPTPVTLDAAVAGNTEILTTGTTLKGSFSINPVAKGNLVAPWDTASTSSNGVVRDLNGDGSLDVGGASSTSSTGSILINSGSLVSSGNAGDFTEVANGREWRVARYTFTVTGVPPGSSTGVNFGVPAMSALARAARVTYNADGGAVETGSLATNIAVAAPVLLSAPSTGAEIVVEQPAGTNIAGGDGRSFGNISVGSSGSLTFTIKNVGNLDLTGLGITFDGADAAIFSVTANPVAPIVGPTGSTTFTVQFAPTSRGPKTAALHIANNDADESPFDILFSGTGLSTNANLANLTLSAGSLTPAFTPATTSYSVAVPYSASLTFTPTTEDASATVKVNGVTVVSGAASGPLSLNVGLNVIPVLVQAESGSTKTYTVEVTRAGPLPGDVDSAFAPVAVGSYVTAMAVQPDGKVVLGGTFTSVGGQPHTHLARLNANGTVESTATFNPGTDADFDVTCLAVQSDGKILVGGGFSSVNGQIRRRIARLNANGSVESTATFDVGTGANSYVYAVAVQADGKILLAGDFTTVNGLPRNRIARLLANGTVEDTSTFNPGIGANNTVASVAVQADGKILLGGIFTSVGGLPRPRVARLNANGSVEDTATFNVGTGANYFIYSLAVQADGKILLGGEFSTINGLPRGGIARLLADGTVEGTATFDTGTGADLGVTTMAVQADGKILLGGDFTMINGQTRHGLARLQANGAVESLATFNPGSGADGTVSSVVLRADGKILLGGSFANVDGKPAALLARLFNEPATQALTIPANTRVEWARGGAGPEVEQVTFELSTNGGASWSPLGVGTRIAGGWESAGLNLTGFDQIRVRGRTTGSAFSGSSGLVEQIAAFDFVTQTPVLTAPTTGTGTTSPVSIAFTLPEAALPGSVTLTFHDGVTARVLTLAASQETAGAHAFSFDTAVPTTAPQVASGGAVPNGTYAVTLSYRDLLGNAAASSVAATGVLIGSPLQVWKFLNLGDAEASDLGDPDFDGLLTLAEYGLNFLPQTSNPAQLAATRFPYAEGQRLRVIFQRNPAHSDVTLEVQAAPALAGPWTTVATSTLGGVMSGPGYVGGDSAGPGLKTVEVRDVVNVDDSTAHFLRVKVTR